MTFSRKLVPPFDTFHPRKPRSREMNVFDKMPTFEEWCEANGLDAEDDENYNAYCEWKGNAQ